MYNILIMTSTEQLNSFADLSKSKNFDERSAHDFLIKLLDTLFDKHDSIIIDKECETKKNEELIKSQLPILEYYFGIPRKVRSNKRCVRQTLKRIVDSLNEKYQFKNPIKFVPHKKSLWRNDTCVSYCYAELIL